MISPPACRLDATRLRQALGMLVAAGLAVSDGFSGLRMLMAAAHGRPVSAGSPLQLRRPLDGASAHRTPAIATREKLRSNSRPARCSAATAWCSGGC